MKKKIAIIVIVAVALTCGLYFGIGAIRPITTPYLETGLGIGISEAEVVGNPGGYEVGYITVINGQDKDRRAWISVEVPSPNKVRNGYEPLPAECCSWFTPIGWDGEHATTEPMVFLKAGEIRKVSIGVSIPYNTTFLDRPAQVMIQAVEVDPYAFQLTGAASIWYILVVETPED